MFLRSLISLAAVLAFPCASALAAPSQAKEANVEMHHHDHHAMQAIVKPKAASSKGNASTRAYEAAMERMHKNMAAPLSGNADVDFVRQMIPHHQGAVDMAKIQLQYGHDERLKRLCEWIIFAQEQEIGFMKNWLNRRDNGAVVKAAPDHYGAAMKTMHHAMMIDYIGDADIDFVRGMIPHHQGAVDMASILMERGSDPDLKQLAADIHRSQTQEIAWMERWLARREGK
jgi:uncharacterized protein (DUF305 family)